MLNREKASSEREQGTSSLTLLRASYGNQAAAAYVSLSLCMRVSIHLRVCRLVYICWVEVCVSVWTCSVVQPTRTYVRGLDISTRGTGQAFCRSLWEAYSVDRNASTCKDSSDFPLLLRPLCGTVYIHVHHRPRKFRWMHTLPVLFESFYRDRRSLFFFKIPSRISKHGKSKGKEDLGVLSASLAGRKMKKEKRETLCWHR